MSEWNLNALKMASLFPPDGVEAEAEAVLQLSGEEQARQVIMMLSHARTGLLAAIAAQDLPQIVQWKTKAYAIQEVSKQLRLSRRMQLDAAALVRRTERALGVGIREEWPEVSA